MRGTPCDTPEKKEIFTESCESCLCLNGVWECNPLRCVAQNECPDEGPDLALDAKGCNICWPGAPGWVCTRMHCKSECPCPQNMPKVYDC